TRRRGGEGEETLKAGEAMLGLPLGPAQRGQALAVLGRLDEAAAELARCPESDASAALLLAAVLQDQEAWDESDRHFRRALALLATPEQTPAVTAARVRACTGLAFNARAAKRFREAEAVSREALEKVPEAVAEWHLQMGRHYQLAGRPARAVEHLDEAARLDPSLARQTRPLLDD